MENCMVNESIDAADTAFYQNPADTRIVLPTLCVAFFLSGCPALIYQLTWQRSLFTIYGVNIESISVIVTAFMLGLGLGSLLGGAISKSSRYSPLLIFAVIELTIGVFGFFSLSLLDIVGAHTLGASALDTFFITLLLVLLPTVLMGATLPLLVIYLVRRFDNVGRSVGILYFANTLGSAVACFAVALWLLRELGMSGTVTVAAAMNIVVGLVALVIGLVDRSNSRKAPANDWPASARSDQNLTSDTAAGLSFVHASVVVALVGYISLSYEILWARLYSYLTSGSSAAFSLMLGAFLMGIAMGSIVSRRFCRLAASANQVRTVAYFLLLANVIGFLVAPTVSFVMLHTYRWTATLLMVTVAAGMLGAAFPLICHLAIAPNARAGSRLSYLYFANIVGAAAGSLITGFVLLDYWSFAANSMFLAVLGIGVSTVLLILVSRVRVRNLLAAGGFAIASVAVVALALPSYDAFYERLLYKWKLTSGTRFADTVETRSGVINVTPDGTIFGGGGFDGIYSTDLVEDRNGIVRPYFLGALHAKPNRVLMIGLASGAWAQVVANHPSVEQLIVVEINEGYLRLISKYPQVASLLQNPKVKIEIDDGRRWLTHNDDMSFDVIIMNTTQHFRAHVSSLLSVEFLNLARLRLRPRGLLYFNATGSYAVHKTAMTVFPHGIRVRSMIAVSDDPIKCGKGRLHNLLTAYEIDGKLVFGPGDAARLNQVVGMCDDIGPVPPGAELTNAPSLESRTDILTRTAGDAIVTDDNMYTEWHKLPPGPIPWGS